MRRLQIHISHQLADRFTANTEGEAISDGECRDEYRSGRSVSAKSGKSVTFAKDAAKPKLIERLLKGTAASKEKTKQKAVEAAALANLREKHRLKSLTKLQRHGSVENESAPDEFITAEDEAILGGSGAEDESMMDVEVEEDDHISESDHSSSYTRSSISSRYNSSALQAEE